MAGAGYKLFATGDVLTAAQVNTYLMQQTVMVFASSAARTTALSGVLAEGMVSYLQDTNTLEVYNGSGWVGATGDITGLTAGTGISITSETGPVPTVAIDTAVTVDLTTAQTLTTKTLTSPVLTTPSISNIDAKGDILVGTANNTLGVITAGANGETLVADSSTGTGLRWQGTYAAGKNKIINGDFTINQRAFTSVATNGSYGFDRWQILESGGTTAYTPQTFTPGTAPVAGYESINFARVEISGQTTSSNRCLIQQRIEDVRTFAGQTATFSFWAKASSGTPNIAFELLQNFGSGGSPSTQVTTIGVTTFTLSTSWTRYSVTVNVPSISGKTLGTTANTSFLTVAFWLSGGSDFNARTNSLGLQAITLDLWGVQAEAGSVATPFQTATGTIQGELAACQRYCIVYSGDNTIGNAPASSTTAVPRIPIATPAVLRTTPTMTISGTLQTFDGVTATNVTTLGTIYASQNIAQVQANVASGLTQYRNYSLFMNSGSLTISAEL